jgi:hypothetical protein
MGIYIVLAIAVVVLAALAFVFVALQKSRRKASAASDRYQSFLRRREYASHGTALVIRADGSIPGEGATQVRVLLTLEATLPGGKPYRTHADWFVQLMALDNLKQGSQIAVRIDAQDKDIIYPAEEWAKYIPE